MIQKCMLFIAILSTIELVQVHGQDFFEFSGERTSVQFSEGRERTVLEGNARVISESVELTADYIELYGTDFRFTKCVGNVQYSDSKQEIYLFAEELFFDRDTKFTRAKGYVEIDDKKNKIVLKSGYLEIINDTNNFTAQTNTRIFREDLVARSEILQFDREKEKLQLLGFPVAYWKEDEYQAQKITIDLKKETIDLVGQVAGVIKPSSNNTKNDTADSTAQEPSVPEPSVPEPSVPEPSVPEPSAQESSVPEPSVPEPSVPEPSVPEPSVPEPDTE